MYIFNEPNAYDIIQKFVELNLDKILNKQNFDIKNICVVGAYHGYEIERLLFYYPNSFIYAFEGVKEHFLILEKKYSKNKRVKLFNKVVSDYVGEIKFYELGNGGEGSGSLLKFQGDKYGHPFNIKQELILPCTTLSKELSDIKIDLLWVDVQGAELQVLKGTNLCNCESLFLEIHTHDYVQMWDKEPYEGQCYKEDLEEYLKDFYLHSIGLDNATKNGQGNSFWLKK